MFVKSLLTLTQMRLNMHKDEIIDNPLSVMARNLTEFDIQELINSYTRGIEILTEHLVNKDHL